MGDNIPGLRQRQEDTEDNLPPPHMQPLSAR